MTQGFGGGSCDMEGFTMEDIWKYSRRPPSISPTVQLSSALVTS